MSEYCFTSFIHNHGNIATEGSPKPGLCPTLISNDCKCSVECTVQYTAPYTPGNLEHCI